MNVRRVIPEDWQDLRALRLEALQSAPDAYVERYAAAIALDDAAWQERTKRSATSDERAMFLAEDERALVGMAGVFLEGDHGVVVAVYLVPAARGAGVLELLLDAIREWTRARGRVALTLWVHERNVRARRAYARLGFVETGAREPFAPDPRADELEMRASFS